MRRKEFESLFRKVYLPLGMYALRMVEDVDIAEDLVQDSFLKAWLVLEEGQEIENLKSYMYSCVRNECISFLRQKRENIGVESIPEVDEEIVDTSERDAALWRAIDALPDRCRDVFLLSKRDGLSQEEIAAELGISVKTVKNQMTKAFSRLREVLAKGYKPFFLPFL